MSDPKRVVLVMPKPDPRNLGEGDSRRLEATLDRLAALGWTPVAVIDPARHLDALRMVLGGMADLVVVTRPEDFPLVRLSSDLDASRSARRTMRLPRPDGTAVEPRQRRPQPLEPVVPQRDTAPEIRERVTDFAPEIPQAVAQFGRAMAESSSRRRASDRHRRTGQDRRRRSA